MSKKTGSMDKMVTPFWRHKRVFITGCNGFLGSWLTKSLVEKEATVIGLIRDVNPDSQLYHSHLDQHFIQIRGDLTNYLLLERILNEYEIDTIFHLAAQPLVEIANWSPLSTFESNIRGSWNLLEAARRARLIERIIIASSDKVYGEQASLPYVETMTLNARHPYDVSKSCVDHLAISYQQTFSLPLTILRCANFFGGGDLNFNRLIPGTIRSVIFGERPRIRSSGNLSRDYLYISDAVAAFLLVAQKFSSANLSGEIFNFSCEINLMALEVVRQILTLMKSPLKLVIENRAKHEITHQYLSCQKARSRLGWRPQYNFTQGLKQTINWYKQFFKKQNK